MLCMGSQALLLGVVACSQWKELAYLHTCSHPCKGKAATQKLQHMLMCQGHSTISSLPLKQQVQGMREG
jgi:hypothetical protein